jgi:thiol-disulfide isomerase/thioredoxin
MKNLTRWLVLVGVLVVVVGSVIYLESLKVSPGDFGDTEQVVSKEGFVKAPELVGIAGYLNGASEGLMLSDLRGKVVLVDFWTYSCINCIRTLPYLKAWDKKYGDMGLVILGVHTPEFEFEKDRDNVLDAIAKYEIEYPVVQDNEFGTWRAFNNRYWPRKYLVDAEGFIRYDHIGEGGYEETEQMIQKLLGEKGVVVSDEVVGIVDEGRQVGTPEIYFGFAFYRDQLGNVEGLVPGEVVQYILPENLQRNKFYLEGSWKNEKDDMELVSSDGKIVIGYIAKDVNIVAGADSPVKLSVSLDGEVVDTVVVDDFDLYNIVSLEESGFHVLEIEAEEGLKAYTFTFG